MQATSGVARVTLLDTPAGPAQRRPLGPLPRHAPAKDVQHALHVLVGTIR